MSRNPKLIYNSHWSHTEYYHWLNKQSLHSIQKMNPAHTFIQQMSLFSAPCRSDGLRLRDSRLWPGTREGYFVIKWYRWGLRNKTLRSEIAENLHKKLFQMVKYLSFCYFQLKTFFPLDYFGKILRPGSEWWRTGAGAKVSRSQSSDTRWRARARYEGSSGNIARSYDWFFVICHARNVTD